MGGGALAATHMKRPEVGCLFLDFGRVTDGLLLTKLDCVS